MTRNATSTPMEDVVVTQEGLRGGGPLALLCLMQVCAYGGTPPARIEDRANELNPTGLSHGWKIVWGDGPEDDSFNGPNKKPVPCAEIRGRLHYLLSC